MYVRQPRHHFTISTLSNPTPVWLNHHHCTHISVVTHQVDDRLNSLTGRVSVESKLVDSSTGDAAEDA